MAAVSMKHIQYKPTTLFRRVLTPADEKPKMLCSVWPEPLTRPDPTGTHITIPGRPDQGAAPQDGAYFLPKEGGEPVLTNRFGYVMVGPGVERDDLGSVRTLALLSISSRRRAMDLIGLSDPGVDEVDGHVIASAETGENPESLAGTLKGRGYFVPKGDFPTEAELLEAESRRQRWLIAALKKGDRVWNNTQKLDAVPPESIAAARFLNQPRVWAPSADAIPAPIEIQTFACPCCGEPVPERSKNGKCLNCNEALGVEPDGTHFWWNDPRRKARLVAAKLAGDLNGAA